ncbi:ATPase, T2SS/T4P/T4SS family [Lentisphaerota bacterium ZTH]|nr:Flp pilus assembly complex ATPase component TadA [Lentisphaerota bacterium]WET06861.1 ATPase, T2SS/T4P/T4SS family [Lentisphaerota bacterium ZTH]
MFELIIRQPDQGDALGKLVPGSYLVGSGADCHIQFNRPEISGRHAQFILRNNQLTVIDLDSSNGTCIDGSQVQPNEPREVQIGATVSIGMVKIICKGPESSDLVNSKAEKTKPNPEKEKRLKSISRELKKASRDSSSERSSEKEKIPLLKISGISENVRPLVQEIKKRAHLELLKRLNLKKMALSGISEHELEEKAKATITEILSELTIPLPKGVKLEQVERELVQEAIGLGPLEYLTALDEITEIMVNGPDSVYVESKGTLYRTDTAFADNAQVLSAIERIVSPLGRRIDESSPMVDARLPDGSRVNAIIPPLSLAGPSITIRKFSKTPFQISDLINFGTVTEEMAEFLRACVKVRKNIIISGGTGSGKTTLLNVLSSYLPNRERIITIEDAAELQLHQEHIVRLESRPPNIEGKGAITIRDLVRNSLRMRPDRIVVGECRGGEALDMLQAMNTGHDGSLTTVHANTPRDALARLETLVLMAGFDLPLRAIREQIASAINIIVQVNRERDGSRKITHISEITKMEGEVITLQDIFIFKHEGWDDNNRITGSHRPTGNVPTFMEDIARAKIALDISIFDNEKWRNH